MLVSLPGKDFEFIMTSIFGIPSIVIIWVLDKINGMEHMGIGVGGAL